MIRIAYHTLAAFDAAVSYDQGAAYRQNLERVIPHIGDAYRGQEDGLRSHLGASVLGKECGREIAYSWRWASRAVFDGRMLRLFNRGHLEEARFIALLLTIGVQVYQQDANGKQFRISFASGHAGGSGDGVGVGIPDLQPGTPALTEFKTHSESSFTDLSGPLAEWRKHLSDPRKHPFKGKGVREAKFEHFVQMQLYMRHMGIPQALYVAVNKNTDDIYAEIVLLDTDFADQFTDRGCKIVWSNELPKRINKSPGYYGCRFCDFKRICHYDEPVLQTCRMCKHSFPDQNSDQWICGLRSHPLNKDQQLAGCDQWQRLPNN